MESITVVSLLDVIGELFSDEISIAVSNTSEYIYYRPSKRIDLKIRPGDRVKEGTITYKALGTQQRVSEFIDRDVFGVPYHGMAVPFLHEGKLEGCVTAIFPALTDGKSVVTMKTNDGGFRFLFPRLSTLRQRIRRPMYILAAIQAPINTRFRILSIHCRRTVLSAVTAPTL